LWRIIEAIALRSQLRSPKEEHPAISASSMLLDQSLLKLLMIAKCSVSLKEIAYTG
jgi:hypothetical protein